MKIGIMSDSHGNVQAMETAVKMAGKVTLWLHAGDCREDAEYLKILSQTRVVYVNGNCDWPEAGGKDEAIVEAEGHRVFLTHGHIYGVRQDTSLLAAAAAANQADIAVYGHTHIAELTPGSLYVLNPGSVSRPRDEARASFMVMELVADQVPKVKLSRIEK